MGENNFKLTFDEINTVSSSAGMLSRLMDSHAIRMENATCIGLSSFANMLDLSAGVISAYYVRLYNIHPQDEQMLESLIDNTSSREKLIEEEYQASLKLLFSVKDLIRILETSEIRLYIEQYIGQDEGFEKRYFCTLDAARDVEHNLHNGDITFAINDGIPILLYEMKELMLTTLKLSEDIIAERTKYKRFDAFFNGAVVGVMISLITIILSIIAG